MFIPKATCYSCNVPFRPKKNDITVQANSGFGPYYKIAADLWYCPECNAEIITGFAHEPIIAAHEKGFKNVPFDAEVNL